VELFLGAVASSTSTSSLLRYFRQAGCRPGQRRQVELVPTLCPVGHRLPIPLVGFANLGFAYHYMPSCFVKLSFSLKKISGGSREELRFTPGDGTVKSLLAGRSELVSNRSWFELLNDATVYGLF